MKYVWRERFKMKKISESINQPLKWEQPSALKMSYELHTGEETAGTLQFRSSLGSFATAESADGCWTFKRVGFWQTRVTIRECGAETEIATFKNNTWSSVTARAFGQPPTSGRPVSSSKTRQAKS